MSSTFHVELWDQEVRFSKQLTESWFESESESEVTQSCPTLCDPHGLSPTRLLSPWNFPGKSTGVGCHFLLQGIFPIQGLNPGLPHCRQTLYRLSHQGSPMIVKRVGGELYLFTTAQFKFDLLRLNFSLHLFFLKKRQNNLSYKVSKKNKPLLLIYFH